MSVCVCMCVQLSLFIGNMQQLIYIFLNALFIRLHEYMNTSNESSNNQNATHCNRHIVIVAICVAVAYFKDVYGSIEFIADFCVNW